MILLDQRRFIGLVSFHAEALSFEAKAQRNNCVGSNFLISECFFDRFFCVRKKLVLDLTNKRRKRNYSLRLLFY